MEYRSLLTDFVNACNNILEENLVGVYLHGSLAMGCFNPKKSDIDLLVVACGELTHEQKLQFMRRVVELNESAPPKGLELSVVRAEYLRPFVYPTPYELHFSPTHLDRYCRDPDEYARNFHGVDPDLAAHVTITNRYGVTLCGRPIPEVFGEVPRECYLDSIRLDVENAADDIVRDPVYITLNICRVAAYAECGLVLSKSDGGRWGLSNLPRRLRPLVEMALSCYESDADFEFDAEIAADFARFMLDLIESRRTPR